MMPTDLKELLRAFNDHGVKYLVVGGYAYGVHPEPRATTDLDIFIRSDQQNSQAVFHALAQFHTTDGLSIGDFMDGSTFQISVPAVYSIATPFMTEFSPAHVVPQFKVQDLRGSGCQILPS